MRRCLVMLLAGCLLTLADAQERRGYVGFGVSYGVYLGAYPSYPMPSYPMPSLHLAGRVLEVFELRGTLESLFAISHIGADVLYPVALGSVDTRLYTGGGVSVRGLGSPPVGVDLRGILGGEYPLVNLGVPVNLFAEMRFYVQAGGAEFPTFEGQAGINFPF